MNKEIIGKLEKKCELYKTLASKLALTISYVADGVDKNSTLFETIANEIESIGNKIDIITQEITSLQSNKEQSLPTNKEIINEAGRAFPSDDEGIPDSHTYSFCQGAEWMRNKITE